MGAGPSFPIKLSNRAAAPSLSLRSLQGQGGEFDLAASSPHGDQNPRPVAKDATRGGAPSRAKMRKAWASPQRFTARGVYPAQMWATRRPLPAVRNLGVRYFNLQLVLSA